MLHLRRLLSSTHQTEPLSNLPKREEIPCNLTPPTLHPLHRTLSISQMTKTAFDADMDPGNEDPGSQFDRDATVPLIDPDK